MKSSATVLAVAIAIGWAAAGCSEAADPIEPAHDTAEFAATESVEAQSLDRGGPPGFEELAAEIPGFAGYWIDRRCNINVMLVDLSQAEKARALLAPVLERLLATHPRCPRDATIIVHKADFSWIQLTGWLKKLRPLGAVRGVLRMGISIPDNRIVIVLASRTLHATVVAEIQRLDVPLAAVKFLVHPPTTDGTGRTRSG